MWPSGNCGHVYSSSHTQARRHISGWAMRNTNNHNINILKKSCLGVLVCSSNCRKTDGNVVAVRPAICDKARRKQIGRKCPNSCGGVLIMQQCKGHSGYPVTHFWRHHGDKVFFLGKGHHDHPKPELKLSSEKRKAYIRVPNRKNVSAISSHTRARLATTGHRRLSGLNTCKYPGVIAQPNNTYQPQPTNIYQHQLNPPPYPYPIQTMQECTPRLIMPDSDIYIPSISQELLSSSKQMPVYPSLDMPYKLGYDPPNYYQLAMNPSPFPVDYSINSGSLPVGYSKQIETYTRNASFQDTGAILDLSLPVSTAQLDSSWQSDPPDVITNGSRFITKNVAHFQTSTLTMSSEVFGNPIMEAARASASTSTCYEQRREEVPMKLKALWDSMYPADEPNVPLPEHYQPSIGAVKVTPVPTITAVEFETKGAAAPDVSLKEMMDIDDLDMGDISNILNIPAGSAKPPARAAPDVKPLSQTGALPNLSSFLRGIEYL